MNSSEIITEGEDLWGYTCGLYAEKGVEQACLSLQNNNYADVNIILFICWLVDRDKYYVDEALLKLITTTAQAWQDDVVKPLRSLRKQIGSMQGLDARQVKSSLLRSELEAEKSEQLALLEVVSNKNNLAKSKNRESQNTKAQKWLLLYLASLAEPEEENTQASMKASIDLILDRAFSK